MADVIARVRLAKGRVGYFDELTRIHLTVSNPEKPVFAGMNTANIKRAVRSGVLRLVYGSLELEAKQVQKDMHADKAAVEVKTVKAEPAKAVEPAKAEQAPEVPAVEPAPEVAPVETAATEAVEEAAAEEAEEVKEEAPKKATRRKKPAAEEKTEE